MYYIHNTVRERNISKQKQHVIRQDTNRKKNCFELSEIIDHVFVFHPIRVQNDSFLKMFPEVHMFV